MLVLLTFGGGGGGSGGVVQNRESPDFRSAEVGRYVLWKSFYPPVHEHKQMKERNEVQCDSSCKLKRSILSPVNSF